MDKPNDVAALSIAEVVLRSSGFDLARLGYLRWLVRNGRNPETVGIRPAALQVESPSITSQQTLKPSSPRLHDTRAEWL